MIGRSTRSEKMNNKNEEKFDLCVIGGGSAGLSVAAGLAQMGLKTVLLENGKMGGDCLNTGCVPSKALLSAAKIAHNFQKARDFGVSCAEPEINFSSVKDHVFQVISSIEPNDSQERFESLGVTVIREKGVFTGADTIEAGERVIRARNFVIATGSRASIPPIPGLDKEKILTNENIFDLREKPKKLIIIGGGPIGIEMAQAHRRLGCQVIVLDMGTILPKDDPDLVAVLKSVLEKEGIGIFEKIKIVKVAHTEESVSVFLEQGKETIEISGSHLLVAAGRQVNVDGLGLEKAGVSFDKRGIKTDSRLRTSNKNIYAAGDVAGGPQFTHVAAYHAGIIVRNIAFKMPAQVSYKALPWITYTDPELANVGMTNAMAIEKYGKDKVASVSLHLKENDRAQAQREVEGMIKVTILKNGKILGASILSSNAGDMLGLWGLAVQKGMKLSDIAGMIVAYPTLSEASKRVAGSWYTPKLFSEKTRKIVQFLQKLPF